MKRIYLVEDEDALSKLMSTYLEEEGYSVTIFNDGLDAKKHIPDKPDIWILDIMLPGMDGYSLIKAIKQHSPEIPVIFTSARNAELDRVIGLEMGSDDYLPKPFLPRELVIRVNLLLSRFGSSSAASSASIVCGYKFDSSKRAVYLKEEQIPLSVKEYELFAFLISNQNVALSREQMINGIWGDDYFGSDRVVDDTIRRLRKKLPDLSIEPIYGYGYIFKGDVHEK